MYKELLQLKKSTNLNTRMAGKHVKRRSTPLGVGKRTAKPQGGTAAPPLGQLRPHRPQPRPPRTAGSTKRCSCFGNSLEVPRKVPQSCPGAQQPHSQAHDHTDTCSRGFAAAASTTVKRQKHILRPSTENGHKSQEHACPHEHVRSSAVHGSQRGAATQVSVTGRPEKHDGVHPRRITQPSRDTALTEATA